MELMHFTQEHIIDLCKIKLLILPISTTVNQSLFPSLIEL